MNADGSLWIRFNQTETRNGFKFPEIREKERKSSIHTEKESCTVERKKERKISVFFPCVSLSSSLFLFHVALHILVLIVWVAFFFIQFYRCCLFFFVSFLSNWFCFCCCCCCCCCCFVAICVCFCCFLSPFRSTCVK